MKDTSFRLRRLAAQAEQLRPESARTQVLADVLNGAFPEQVAYVRDPAKRLFILATRRAAKSFSYGLKCLDDAFAHPDHQWNYLFCGLTRDSARRVFWRDVLKFLDRKFQLGLTFNESLLQATLPTGSVISLYGADSSTKQHDRLLGQKFRMVGIDEAQAWVSLEDLVKSTIAPSLVDCNGSLTLCGTPGPLIHGWFAQVTRGCSASKLGPASLREPGWSGHCWRSTANPYVREQFEADRLELLKDNPRVEETPSYRANWLGEWCVDDSLLVYPGFSLERNTYDGTLPTFEFGGEWHNLVGIDLGWNDPSAFVVGSWHDFDNVLYIRESFAASQMDLTDVADRVKMYERKYNPEIVVVDGAAKQAVQEMVRRHGVALVPTDKRDKSEFQALLNDDLVQGKVKIHAEACLGSAQGRNSRNAKDHLTLVEELQSLIWDQKRLPRHVEHPSCSQHQLDALLYLHRWATPYLSSGAPKPVPPPGTAAWADAEADRMLQAEWDAIQARKEEDREGLGDSSNWEWWVR